MEWNQKNKTRSRQMKNKKEGLRSHRTEHAWLQCCCAVHPSSPILLEVWFRMHSA